MITRKKLAKDLINKINCDIPRETTTRIEHYDIGESVCVSYYGEKPEYFRKEMSEIIKHLSKVPLYEEYWFIDELRIEPSENKYNTGFNLISTYKGKQKKRYNFILHLNRFSSSPRIEIVEKEVPYHEISLEARMLLGNKLFYDYNDVFNAEMDILKKYFK